MDRSLNGKKKRNLRCYKCGFTFLTCGQTEMFRCPKCKFHPTDKAEKEIYLNYIMNG